MGGNQNPNLNPANPKSANICPEPDPMPSLLLLCSISLVIADFVLEFLLNSTYYGLQLEARVVNDLRIHVVSNKSSCKVAVMLVQLLK